MDRSTPPEHDSSAVFSKNPIPTLSTTSADSDLTLNVSTCKESDVLHCEDTENMAANKTGYRAPGLSGNKTDSPFMQSQGQEKSVIQSVDSTKCATLTSKDSEEFPASDGPTLLKVNASNKFENTLAHFLQDEADVDVSLNRSEDPVNPLNSVYELLSDETRDYLSKHCRYPRDTKRYCDRNSDAEEDTLQAKDRKSVHIRDPPEILPSNDALTNYMRTMQRYIGKSSFQSVGRPLSFTSSKNSAKTFSSDKTLSGNKYGYESLENVARTLDSSVRRWLISLRLPNLAKYLKIFDDNEIDSESLKLLSENQLRRMGINSYGPLNKMLHSIRVMRNCQPPRIRPPRGIGLESDEKTTDDLLIRLSTPVKRRIPQKASKRNPSSAPGSARKSACSRDSLKGRNYGTPQSTPRCGKDMETNERKEKCLLRLLAKPEDAAPPSSARSTASKSSKAGAPHSARSQVSEVQLVKKAEKEIQRAAAKFHSKLDKDAQEMENKERLDRILKDKRHKFAADYERRKAIMKEAKENQPVDQHKVEGSKQEKKMKHHVRRRPETKGICQGQETSELYDEKNKENSSKPLEHPNIETQMAIDAAKPKLIFEEQLDDLELQIQNLVDMQTLKQSDSRGLLSCIDHLQSQLHDIQSMVVKQRAAVARKASDNEKMNKPFDNAWQREDRKMPSPRNSSSKMEVRFNDRDFIGEGMFTQVYKGKFMNRVVAVKRLKTPLTTEDKLRLAEEVNVLMELKHENICQMTGCMIRMKFPLLVMEYCFGGSVHQLLQKPEPLDHCAYYQIAEDVCAGLSYLHFTSTLSPRVHLRLTSHNVLLDRGLRARLSDVGLSRLRHECSRAIRQAGADRLEWSQLPWMAPEVVSGEDAGTNADIYSLGVLLWEMLMRQTPYAGLTTYQMMERIRDGPPLTLPDSCPVGLRGLIRRCWQLKPIERTTVQEALLSISRLKFTVSWQTVLQSAGITSEKLTDVGFCRRLIAHLLNLSVPPPQEPGRILPPNGPCGLLSFPLPDLELSPVSRIEELAEKASAFVSRPPEDSDMPSMTTLSAELSARGAVWAERRGGRLHDQ